MKKFLVTMTKTVEVEMADGDGADDAIVAASYFLDHEEEEEQDKKDDLPMGVHTSEEGKVVSYDWNFEAKEAP